MTILNNIKYTLNRNIILRKSNKEYSIYDIRTDRKSIISHYLYTILKIFELNSISFSQIEEYFMKKEIPNNLLEIKELLEKNKEYKNILIHSETSNRTKDIYNIIGTDINQFYEFTPESIDFLITNRCNLRCPHCYRESKAQDELIKVDLKRLYTLFDEMEDLKIRSFKITGGEAFLCPELYDIMSYASGKNIHVSVLTNATIPLSERWIKLLKRKNIFVGVSLDGATPFTHDIIRGKGSFYKTLDNLNKFSKNNINFSITFTINKVNRNELNSIINLTKNDLKGNKLTFNFIEKSGRAKDNDDIFSLDKGEIKAIKNEIEKLILDNFSMDIRTVDNNELESTEKELSLIKDKGSLIFCKAGHSILAIDSKLNVYPCIYGIGGIKEYPVASLQEDSLINIWNNSQKLDIFRGKLEIQDLPICRSCQFQAKCNLKHCRLRSIYEGRDFTAPTSFCAKMVAEDINAN